jgi:DNA-binding response OmpR family regulator
LSRQIRFFRIRAPSGPADPLMTEHSERYAKLEATMSFFSKFFAPVEPRILAVDDEPDVLNLLTDILKAAGYKVDGLTNGPDALRQIQKTKYSLIILDNRMPKMSGTEVLQAIRSRPGGEKQAVIMLSAEDMIETMEQAFELGVMEWVCKPFSPERFLAKVAAHMGAQKK